MDTILQDILAYVNWLISAIDRIFDYAIMTLGL